MPANLDSRKRDSKSKPPFLDVSLTWILRAAEDLQASRKLVTKLSSAFYNTLDDLRTVLTPTQLSKFLLIIDKVIVVALITFVNCLPIFFSKRKLTLLRISLAMELTSRNERNISLRWIQKRLTTLKKMNLLKNVSLWNHQAIDTHWSLIS